MRPPLAQLAHGVAGGINRTVQAALAHSRGQACGHRLLPAGVAGDGEHIVQ